MAEHKTSFRVGKVRADCRGKVWYLTYHEAGRRRRPRVGPSREMARQLAAQINAQLETGAPAALSFESVAITELQRRWLDHHEHVLRSSVQTIRRYRSATAHLLQYVGASRSPTTTASFRSEQAAAFVRYLRTIQVAPNGHPNAAKRPLLDKGIKFVLETCRSMFNYACKHRHLSPYAENPFATLDLDRIPVENIRPVEIFTADQELQFLSLCDEWQFPLFLTLMLTGVRPGELTHLLLPDDLDLDQGILWIRNKPRLGWQVKTRNERAIPLVPILAAVLKRVLANRMTGPVFLRRRFSDHDQPLLAGLTASGLERELASRVAGRGSDLQRALTRAERLSLARTVWRDAGLIKTERIRIEFSRLTRQMKLPQLTAPKLLRHLFATCLQDANVDPLIRNELMGHAPAGLRSGTGLGMTANYTHTRATTKRNQLEAAMGPRFAIQVAERWLQPAQGTSSTGVDA